MKKKKDLGAITVGRGTPHEREIKIVDFVQSTFLDNRTASVFELENGGFILAVENPESSGRNPSAKILLSKESLTAILATAHIFFNLKEMDIDKMLIELTKGKKIEYSTSMTIPKSQKIE